MDELLRVVNRVFDSHSTSKPTPLQEFLSAAAETIPNSIHCLMFLSNAQGNLELARRMARQHPRIDAMLTDADWQEAVRDAEREGYHVERNLPRTHHEAYVDIHGDGYDYEHQAWVRNWRYEGCNHPPELNCYCYGRLHAGEPFLQEGPKQ